MEALIWLLVALLTPLWLLLAIWLLAVIIAAIRVLWWMFVALVFVFSEWVRKR